MENVTAGTSDARGGRQSLDVADCTVLVTVNTVQVRVSFSTLFIQTRKAFRLSSGTAAGMATG
jgi:hypothetical protein